VGIRLDIKSELPTAIKWTNQHTKQLPFSIAQAINASVQGSKFIAGSKQKSALNKLAGASRRYLDRPKPSTQKGFRATVAKKSTLTSVIKTKDRPYNQDRYLGGSIFGGDSKQKYDAIFVRHSTATNIPGNSRLVPTTAVKRDRYGNITKTTINKIYKSIGTEKSSGNNVFIGKPSGGNRPAGVYRRERGNKLRALFIAQQSVNYSPIFPAKKEAEGAVRKTFGLYLRRQLQVNVRNNMARKA
tara:strand:+ start:2033 stop:2761 length:729 start_codon:yes stop_codon:yes gene_type:complete